MPESKKSAYIHVRIDGRDALFLPGEVCVAMNRAEVFPEEAPTRWARFLHWLVNL
jgi:hypothetical protein